MSTPINLNPITNCLVEACMPFDQSNRILGLPFWYQQSMEKEESISGQILARKSFFLLNFLTFCNFSILVQFVRWSSCDILFPVR